MKICIVYYSGNGHTEKLMAYIKEGILSASLAQVFPINVSSLSKESWQHLNNAEAIIFGSPTYMGGVAAPFKAFMDASGNFWLEQPWANKMAAGFTIGTAYSGDKLGTLMQMAIFACQHSMIWLGQSHLGSKYSLDDQDINQSGSWLGMMATSSQDKSLKINSGDAETARLFGKRIAYAVKRWAESRPHQMREINSNSSL